MRFITLNEHIISVYLGCILKRQCRGDYKMNVAYVRVSTEEQNTERQFVDLADINLDKVFEEKISGRTMERPKLKEMIEYLREGDTLYIESFSRLARSRKDLFDTLDKLEQKGVHIVSKKENFDTSSSQGRLMRDLMIILAQFEVDLLRERQLEGIAIAKKDGKYKGRKPKIIDEDRLITLYDLYMKRKITVTEIAKELHISRSTVYKKINELGLNQLQYA